MWRLFLFFFESMLFFSYFDFIFAFKALLLSLKAWIKKNKGFHFFAINCNCKLNKTVPESLFYQACMLSVQNYGLVKSPPGVDCANATAPNFITNWSKIRPNSELFVLVRFSTLPWCEFCWYPNPKRRLDDFKRSHPRKRVTGNREGRTPWFIKLTSLWRVCPPKQAVNYSLKLVRNGAPPNFHNFAEY